MAATQDLLRDAWHGGQADRMSPWEQARALAFREASREIHGGRVNAPWVAGEFKLQRTQPLSGLPQAATHDGRQVERSVAHMSSIRGVAVGGQVSMFCASATPVALSQR